MPTERTVRKNLTTQIYANTTNMANMRKQNVRTGMDKAWGMRARRAVVGGTRCNCCISFGRGERLTIWWIVIANCPPTKENWLTYRIRGNCWFIIIFLAKHSTSSERANWRGWPLNIFTWFMARLKEPWIESFTWFKARLKERSDHTHGECGNLIQTQHRAECIIMLCVA